MRPSNHNLVVSVIRRKAAFFIICLLALTVSWFLIPREPAYQGKALSTWLRDFDFRSQQGAGARAAVRAIGTNSLPTLISYLTHRDKPLKLRFVAFARQHGILAASLDDDFLWHRRAALACGVLGLAAEPALPVLAEAATNSQAPEQVVEALSKMLPKSTAVLANIVLTCKSKAACDKAIISLVDACSYPQVAALSMAGLSDALQRFDTASGAVVALAGLRGGNYSPEIREAAARTLGTFDATAQHPPIQTPSERAWRRRFSVPAD